jgi:hypothetical protein
LRQSLRRYIAQEDDPGGLDALKKVASQPFGCGL